MPAPATADEFLDLIRKSEVVEEARLSAYVKQLQATSNILSDMSKFAGLFVRDGILTFFQAEQFLLGKWKRFTIGKYRVLERLGSGGMGQVFLCEHKMMRRKVAVKVLPTAKAEDASSLERFYREARAVAALDHPNIVRAYDIDQDTNLHFLVMEYVDGASLQEIIKKTGQMDVTRACHYMYWSAIGLEHAHQAGLIHRDIKPGNILVDRQGTVKILDLGLARFFNDDEDLLTKKYDENVLGTADYLAPEQAIDSHGVDGRADIYSLGATFYFLLAGAQPFMEGTIAQKLIWHQTRNPKPLRDVRSDIPEGVVAIVETMMAKDPGQRYQSPAQLAEALAPWVQTPIDAPPDAEMPLISAAAAAIGGGMVSTTAARPVVPPVRLATGSGTKQPGSGSPIPAVQPPSGSGKRHPNRAMPARTAKAVSRVVDSEDAARRPTPAPIVESLPFDSDSTDWGLLAADTNNTSQDNTDRQAKPERPRKSPRPIEEEPDVRPAPTYRAKTKKPSIPLAIGLLAVFAAAASFAVYWFGFRASSTPTGKAGDSDFGRLTVSKPGGQGKYNSVRAALAAKKENSHIVILDTPWEEELITTTGWGRGVTIEGPGDKEIVWRVPGEQSKNKIILLQNPEGLTIAGITFDGGGKVSNCIHVSGRAGGLVLRNLVIKDMTEAGIKFEKCSGTEGNPILVQKVHLKQTGKETAEAGILFNANNDKTGAPTEWVNVHDCRFDGPYRSGAFVVVGSVANIELKNNRIWNSTAGIDFRAAKPSQSFKIKVVGNTFVEIKDAAIRFNNANLLNQPPNAPYQEVVIEANYFMNANSIVRSLDNAAFSLRIPPTGNARNGATKEGSPSINAAQIDSQLGLKPEDDATFLRYGKGDRLFTAAPNGKPVGVPPLE